MRTVSLLFLVMAYTLTACSPQIPNESVTVKPTTTSPPTSTSEPATVTVSIPSSTTSTTNQETATIEPVATATYTESPSSTPILREGETIIIDHTNVDQFELIPDSYIEAASKLSLLFKHASVGWNISLSLDCLMNKQPRLGHCHVSPPYKEYADPKYDWTKWVFEFHQPPPSQNPGWYNKVSIFINRINSIEPPENIDVATFKLGYVDAIPGSNIDEEFFKVPNKTYPTIQDLEELELAHPEITFVYTTLALGRSIGSEDARSFNQQLRDYAASHNKILLDLADIESHLPDGTPCYDMNGNGIEALCDEYTSETGGGGHVDGLGSQRLAQAIWLLMARIAGWDGLVEN